MNNQRLPDIGDPVRILGEHFLHAGEQTVVIDELTTIEDHESHTSFRVDCHDPIHGDWYNATELEVLL